MPVKIEMKDVLFSYDVVPILRKISLTVTKGEVVIIGGKSGQGTSTLLELLVGLDRPQSGQVLWDGIDIAGMSQTDLMLLRQQIGYVFETGALISNFSAFENIALPLRSRGAMPPAEIKIAVRNIMEEFGLVGVDNRFPEALSDWQSRAVAVARALIGNPEMLFLDEPVGMLDQETGDSVLRVIEKYWRELGMGIIMISHELSIWPHIPARRIRLEGGKLLPVETSTNNG
jgi:ABC-type lipoprotein export system ATPase subunit